MRSFVNKKYTTRIKIESRCFYALRLRKIIADNELIVVLRYDGDSSTKVNNFRFHLLNNSSKMVLATSGIISSVFMLNNVHFLNTRVFILFAKNPLDLIRALKKGLHFLEDFPFIAFSYKGFFSQNLDLDMLENFQNSYFLRFFVLTILVICAMLKSIFYRMVFSFRLLTYIKN